MEFETVVLGLLGIVALVLMTQRWFWILLFFLGAAASFFAMVASVIQFQLLGAVGFFVLMSIAGMIANSIAEG